MKALDVRSLPSSFKEVRLALAREPGHPDGASAKGYVMLIPLDPDGRIDAEAAADYRQECRVLKFDEDGDKEHGWLRRRPGGSWAIHYDSEAHEQDEPAYRLNDHRFAVGEYVTLQEEDGAHTYRVSSVEKPSR